VMCALPFECEKPIQVFTTPHSRVTRRAAASPDVAPIDQLPGVRYIGRSGKPSLNVGLLSEGTVDDRAPERELLFPPSLGAISQVFPISLRFLATDTTRGFLSRAHDAGKKPASSW
jgi:hypothetical protein